MRQWLPLILMPTWHICQRSSNSLDGKAIMPTKGHSKLTLIANMSGIQSPSRGYTKLDRLSKLNRALLLSATRSHDAPHQAWLIHGNFSMKMYLDEVNPRALLSTLTSTSPPWRFRSPALRHLCHSANGDFTIINDCHCTLMTCDRHNQRKHLRRIRNHALIDQVRASLSNTAHLRSAWVW